MGIVLLIVFLISALVWYRARLIIRFHPLNQTTLLAGFAFTCLGLVFPIVWWKASGTMYVFGPPFTYLILSIIAPYGLGHILISLPKVHERTTAMNVALGLMIAVSLVFPIVCVFYFLAPEEFGLSKLLGVPVYH